MLQLLKHVTQISFYFNTIHFYQSIDQKVSWQMSTQPPYNVLQPFNKQKSKINNLKADRMESLCREEIGASPAVVGQTSAHCSRALCWKTWVERTSSQSAASALPVTSIAQINLPRGPEFSSRTTIRKIKELCLKGLIQRTKYAHAQLPK